ncbi:hypothetical protein PALB_430 [Pseudoalteromonas luteoviolacea B = ATCC 29581]|nr:hypothetical protein PALB_430 [Pseudoalteromonas luteoviolacea B = ATCC 29581]
MIRPFGFESLSQLIYMQRGLHLLPDLNTDVNGIYAQFT